jgi:hypothetical protein
LFQQLNKQQKYGLKYSNREKYVTILKYGHEETNTYLNEMLPTSALDRMNGEARKREEEGAIVNSLRGEAFANTALLIN